MIDPGDTRSGDSSNDPAPLTGVTPAMRQLESMNANPVDLPPTFEPIVDPEPYVTERVFSRKVLVGWAAATLLVWFMISFVGPIVVESAKEAIISSMQEAATNTAAPPPALPATPAPVAAPAVPSAEPLPPAEKVDAKKK
ncbi:MAG TPA: hypothetical protein VHM24_12555 [Gemmatimonadaceae bacterium]|nr:hypothetical protein [Gemmatimonadaceae bacterium]